MFSDTRRILVLAVSSVAMLSGLAAAQQAPAVEKTNAASVAPATPAAPAAQVAPAKAEVDPIKNPVSWFKWGADLRLRHEYANNNVTLNEDAANHEANYERYRARLWGVVTPAENIDLNGRFTWEGRHWWTPETKEEWDWSYVLIDQANVKFSKLFQSNSYIIAGRQDIKLGDGWLVAEGTPGDGSRTAYFDAVNVLIDMPQCKTTANIIPFSVRSEPNSSWLPTIFNDEEPIAISEQNETGGMLYVSNKSIDATTIDAYFIFKDMQAVQARGDDGSLYTLGARVSRDFSKNWTFRAEGAYEFGPKENLTVYPNATDDEVSAWGMLSRLTYNFADEHKNNLRLNLEFLSGDDPDTDTNEAFDINYGRYPQYSDLLANNYAGETRPGDYTNLLRLGIGWGASPTKKLDLIADYNALWAIENTYGGVTRSGYSTSFSSDGTFRGHLITAAMRYKFSPNASALLQGEYFMPGDYYDDPSTDNAVFLRAELVFTY